jgi:hypothetical protein
MINDFFFRISEKTLNFASLYEKLLFNLIYFRKETGNIEIEIGKPAVFTFSQRKVPGEFDGRYVWMIRKNIRNYTVASSNFVC